jgi:hypothetical protein
MAARLYARAGRWRRLIRRVATDQSCFLSVNSTLVNASERAPARMPGGPCKTLELRHTLMTRGVPRAISAGSPQAKDGEALSKASIKIRLMRFDLSSNFIKALAICNHCVFNLTFFDLKLQITTNTFIVKRCRPQPIDRLNSRKTTTPIIVLALPGPSVARGGWGYHPDRHPARSPGDAGRRKQQRHTTVPT